MDVSEQANVLLEKFGKLPQSARMGITFGIAIACCAVYYFMVYQGLMAQREALYLQETKLQRRLSEVRAIAANITAFESEISDLEVKLNAALRQLPNEKQLEVLLTDISNLGKTAGVEIGSFRRQDEVVHDFYAEVPIEIQLSGSYHNIAQFFDLMSKLPRIVNMGAIQMAVGQESTEGTTLTVSGTATTFRFVGNG